MAVRVSDPDAAIEIYVGVLGLDHRRDSTLDGVRNSYVGTSDDVEIQFNMTQGGRNR